MWPSYKKRGCFSPLPPENGAFFWNENRDETCHKYTRIHFSDTVIIPIQLSWRSRYDYSCSVFLKWNVGYNSSLNAIVPLASCMLALHWSDSKCESNPLFSLYFSYKNCVDHLRRLLTFFTMNFTLWIANIWKTQCSADQCPAQSKAAFSKIFFTLDILWETKEHLAIELSIGNSSWKWKQWK